MSRSCRAVTPTEIVLALALWAGDVDPARKAMRPDKHGCSLRRVVGISMDNRAALGQRATREMAWRRRLHG